MNEPRHRILQHSQSAADHNTIRPDGIDSRGFLKCTAWVGQPSHPRNNPAFRSTTATTGSTRQPSLSGAAFALSQADAIERDLMPIQGTEGSAKRETILHISPEAAVPARHCSSFDADFARNNKSIGCLSGWQLPARQAALRKTLHWLSHPRPGSRRAEAPQRLRQKSWRCLHLRVFEAFSSRQT